MGIERRDDAGASEYPAQPGPRVPARALDAPDMPPPPELVEAFGGVNADLLFAVLLAYVAGVIDAGGDVDLA